MTARIPHGHRITRPITAITAIPAAFALTLAVTAAPAAARAEPAPGSAPLFDDGGFEMPNIRAGTLVRYGALSDIGRWTVTAGDVDLVGPGFWQAAEGLQSLDLEGDVSGTIEQTFATTVGVCYAVHYLLAGNVDSEPVVKTGYAQVNQSVLGLPFRPIRRDFAVDTTGKTRNDMGYVHRTFYFRSLSSKATLAFTSTTQSGYGPVLDEVSVTAESLNRCRRSQP
jgi:choice-of-anchor C domain-containing protein